MPFLVLYNWFLSFVNCYDPYHRPSSGLGSQRGGHCGECRALPVQGLDAPSGDGLGPHK